LGKFITFEGIEGSGKTTQIKRVADYLAGENFQLVITQEPSGTDIGAKISDILFHREHVAMCPETELFLFCAARAQHVREVILPALKRGRLFYVIVFPMRLTRTREQAEVWMKTLSE